MESRKYIDCADTPGSNCTLKISGTESEVVKAATEHLISTHGAKNDPTLSSKIQSALKTEGLLPNSKRTKPNENHVDWSIM